MLRKLFHTTLRCPANTEHNPISAYRAAILQVQSKVVHYPPSIHCRQPFPVGPSAICSRTQMRCARETKNTHTYTHIAIAHTNLPQVFGRRIAASQFQLQRPNRIRFARMARTDTDRIFRCDSTFASKPTHTNTRAECASMDISIPVVRVMRYEPFRRIPGARYLRSFKPNGLRITFGTQSRATRTRCLCSGGNVNSIASKMRMASKDSIARQITVPNSTV